MQGTERETNPGDAPDNHAKIATKGTVVSDRGELRATFPLELATTGTVVSDSGEVGAQFLLVLATLGTVLADNCAAVRTSGTSRENKCAEIGS